MIRRHRMPDLGLQCLLILKVNVANLILQELSECIWKLSREEGKDQELIQSSTIPDPKHQLGKRQKHKKT